ncbi:MAG: MBOAT family protein [Lachnospiraceae bacterium]|nr:MBOAT family protein [Lachnospiraceae bacterium]
MLVIGVSLLAAALLAIRILPYDKLITPIGFSFYTLQAIGYLADVYRGKVKAERDFFIYALYVSFFPTVMAGPIQRADGLLKMLKEKVSFDYSEVRHGFLMIAYGFFSKNFVADRLGYLVDRAYEGYMENTGFTLLVGVILYAFQLYCDFLGYSYIALGSARALGFKLDDNFRQPYFSVSVKEFWNRWHISLSSWLRDYVYFPLGGSRKGRTRTLINIFIVFVVSGIWHGRGMTFLVWGILHGLFRVCEEIVGRNNIADKKRSVGKSDKALSAESRISGILRMLLTFIEVDFAWLFFRASSVQQAFEIIRRIFCEFEFSYSLHTGSYAFGLSKKEILVWLLGLLIVLVIDIVHEKGLHLSGWLESRPVVTRWCIYTVFMAFMTYSFLYYYGYSASNFIYAGF